MTKQTKTIENYPELQAKFDETLICDAFHPDFSIMCNPIKTRKLLLEQQAKIDSLTEQNKELQEQKEQAGATFAKAIEYAVDTEGGMDWLREWFNAATYEELVKWGWEDTPEDIFGGLIELNKESK